MFTMAIDIKLSSCDLVKMKGDSVMTSGKFQEGAAVLQSETHKPLRREITASGRKYACRVLVGHFMSDPPKNPISKPASAFSATP